MSLARRLVRGLRLGKEKYFVGTDLEGNAFYERPNPEDPTDWRHAKRSIEYVEERPLSEYRFTSIPVQWSAWMRRTRKDPPTVQELEIDAARQARLKDNVERLRLAYIDEKERLRLETAQVMRRIAEPPSEANAETTTRNAETGPVGLDQVVEQASKKETGQRTSEVGSAGEAEVTGDARLAAQAAQQRQAEREAAKQRREEFARQNPTFGGKGNPGDSAQPDSWQPSAPRRR